MENSELQLLESIEKDFEYTKNCPTKLVIKTVHYDDGDQTDSGCPHGLDACICRNIKGASHLIISAE